MPRAYTGYIDIEARHLFFYFFESRRDPDKDDVVFWTNGGPGGSSALGLFMELGLCSGGGPVRLYKGADQLMTGPCRITGPNSTERFEYAWNSHANVFFIDQPVSVGFSYAEHGDGVVGLPQPDMSGRYDITNHAWEYRAPRSKQRRTSLRLWSFSLSTSPSSRAVRSISLANLTRYVSVRSTDLPCVLMHSQTGSLSACIRCSGI